MATPQLVSTPSDADSLWQAFRRDAAPSTLAFASSLQVDVAVARCAALFPSSTSNDAFYAYVDAVKTELKLWR